MKSWQRALFRLPVGRRLLLQRPTAGCWLQGGQQQGATAPVVLPEQNGRAGAIPEEHTEGLYG